MRSAKCPHCPAQWFADEAQATDPEYLARTTRKIAKHMRRHGDEVRARALDRFAHEAELASDGKTP